MPMQIATCPASGFIDNDAHNRAVQLSNNFLVEVMCGKTLDQAGWNPK